VLARPLRKAGIKSVKALLKMSYDEVLNVPGMTRYLLSHIETRLERKELWLRRDPCGPDPVLEVESVWECNPDVETFGFDPSIAPEVRRALALADDPGRIQRIGATRTRIRPQRVRGTYNVDDWHVWGAAWRALDELIQ
jgi:hypothetical protein